jgi:peptidoglycan hydrolase CwlO-like protein
MSREEIGNAISFIYKSATHIMLAIITFFVVETYNKIDAIEIKQQKNEIIITEIVANYKNSEREINRMHQQIENIAERTETQLRAIQR